MGINTSMSSKRLRLTSLKLISLSLESLKTEQGKTLLSILMHLWTVYSVDYSLMEPPKGIGQILIKETLSTQESANIVNIWVQNFHA
jgi:hypothetical protein